MKTLVGGGGTGGGGGGDVGGGGIGGGGTPSPLHNHLIFFCVLCMCHDCQRTAFRVISAGVRVRVCARVFVCVCVSELLVLSYFSMFFFAFCHLRICALFV